MTDKKIKIIGETFGHFVTNLQVETQEDYREAKRYAYKKIKQVVEKAVSQSKLETLEEIKIKSPIGGFENSFNKRIEEFIEQLKEEK